MTAPLPADPLAGTSIAGFGERLRAGRTSVEETVRRYLERIAALDGQLGAYEHVDGDGAIATAKALDMLLRAGVDLGPLMGVPVAVKDLFAVEGMPTTAGSRVAVADLIGAEGPFIRGLRRAGAVVLGKAKTVEFAFGAAGTNAVRGTPRNPHDASVRRVPGGSSNGSGVAVAAGLCAFAIGSDTGGSVRIPAAFCGVFGLKTTVGVFDTAGVFPLSPTLDSIGLLTRSAADAALTFTALTGRPVAPRPLRSLRFGRPEGYLLEGLDAAVARTYDAALRQLEAAGVAFGPIDLAEAKERETVFPIVLAVELLASLGRARFDQCREAMDPLVAARVARAIGIEAIDYRKLVDRQAALTRIVDERMQGLDAWIAPTLPLVAPAEAAFAELGRGLELTAALTRCSQPVNLFGQCGVSIPIQHLGSALPVGLQLASRPFAEDAALGAAIAVEQLIGTPTAPDLAGFLA
jgi:aspartyl-tRNA(Asn)/glutamyl-tRNA(Gln) amidotransferase subunit A